MPFTVDILPLPNPRTVTNTLAAEWCALEARAECRFFQSWAWVRPRLEQSTGLLLFKVRRDNIIVGLAFGGIVKEPRFRFFSEPVLHINDTGNPVHDCVMVEYNDILAERGCEADVRNAFLTALINDRTQRWSRLSIRSCTPEMSEAVEKMAPLHKLKTRRISESPAAAADLEAARKKGSFLANISSNTRQQIKRSMRIYEERGPLKIERAETIDTAMTYLDALGELHKERWIGRGTTSVFNHPTYVHLHKSIITDQLPTGGVELLKISAGENVIGYLYNFIFRKRIYFYLSGLTYENDNRVKPGFVTHALCAQDHVEHDAVEYDFMAGENRYKTSLGQPTLTMISLIVDRPTLLAFAEHWARRLSGKL
jgi:CelD/BcsL family acetyltransferase involved in cellulose biosynthesis